MLSSPHIALHLTDPIPHRALRRCTRAYNLLKEGAACGRRAISPQFLFLPYESNLCSSFTTHNHANSSAISQIVLIPTTDGDFFPPDHFGASIVEQNNTPINNPNRCVDPPNHFCIRSFLFRKWQGRSVVCEGEIGVFDVQMPPVTQVWPPDDHKGPIHFDVVFFHGLQFGQDAHNMWKTTWATRNHLETCWPQEWLGPQLGNNVRILLLSYDAYVSKSKSHEFGNTGDVSDIGKNLMQSLMTRFD